MLWIGIVKCVRCLDSSLVECPPSTQRLRPGFDSWVALSEDGEKSGQVLHTVIIIILTSRSFERLSPETI